jgi:hypothetical protein
MYVEDILVEAADQNLLKESVILVENAWFKGWVVKFGSFGWAGG